MTNQDDFVRQDTRVLEYLRKCGPRGATMQEMRNHQVVAALYASARVFELKRRGYDIVTQRVSEVDEHGILHHNVSRYFLVGTKSPQLNLFEMEA